MERNQTEAIVRQLAILDNRHVTENVIDSWHKLVGHLSFEVADRALQKAMQDPAIDWVAPKHVLAKSRDAIAELNAELSKPAVEEYEVTGDPMPTCIHGERLLDCSDCCRRLSEEGPRGNRDALNAWAAANVLAGEPF